MPMIPGWILITVNLTGLCAKNENYYRKNSSFFDKMGVGDIVWIETVVIFGDMFAMLVTDVAISVANIIYLQHKVHVTENYHQYRVINKTMSQTLVQHLLYKSRWSRPLCPFPYLEDIWNKLLKSFLTIKITSRFSFLILVSWNFYKVSF